MTYEEEDWLLDIIDQMSREAHQNNLMLRDLCNAVNIYLANHDKENQEDFVRNVFANIISSGIDIRLLKR